MENKIPHEHATPEAFWAGMQELRATQQEIARLLKEQAKETDQLLKKQAKETERREKENEQRIKENEQRIKENERRDRYFNQRFKKLDTLFSNQWGALIESLVEGDLIPLLEERGIRVDETDTRWPVRYDSDRCEFDIVANNGAEAVVVEVKTTLRVNDVDYFVMKLHKFAPYARGLEDKRLYGAVAYLKADRSVQTYAMRQGLFVIRATGASASIINDENFRPKVFGYAAQESG